MFEMTTEFYVLTLATFSIMAWHMSMQHVLSRSNAYIVARTSADAKRQFAIQQRIPQSHVLTYQHDGQRKIPNDSILLTGRWSVGARPVVGDHIHMAVSFWIHGEPRTFAEHDREPLQSLSYEPPFGKDTNICKVQGDVAYQKVWPHAGVHTHCDGLIHVHPWSAPRSLRKEGLDVTLGLWFDQVGIEYREYPHVSIQFADGARYDSNATHQWHVAEKTCFKKKVDTIYTNQFDTIWLGHAYGSYIIWFGRTDSVPPPDIPSHIEHLQSVGVHGAFNRPYPQTCY